MIAPTEMKIVDPSHDAPTTAEIAPLPRVSIQAFCESAEVAARIQGAIGDRRMQKTHVKVQMGGAAAAVAAYQSAPTPNVIVLESTQERAPLLEHLDQLSEFCDSGTKVVVAGRVNDIALYRSLMARGVSEYLVEPFDVLDFVRAMSALYSTPGAAPVGRVITVYGARGGVGASTIAHNLAWSIARGIEVSTVIADFDLAFGTAALDFNQDPPQGVAEAVFAPERIDVNLVERLLSKCTNKLSMLAAPAILDRPYDFEEGAFDLLLDVLRASVPIIVIDLPHTWTAWSRRILTSSDEVVVVAGPDLANLRNTKNILDSLKAARPNDARAKLVLNGTGVPKRPEIDVADFAKALELQPSAIIGYDAKLFGAAANNGQMIAEIDAAHKAAEAFSDLARLVTGRTEIKKFKRSLFDPLLSALGRKSA